MPSWVHEALQERTEVLSILTVGVTELRGRSVTELALAQSLDTLESHIFALQAVHASTPIPEGLISVLVVALKYIQRLNQLLKKSFSLAKKQKRVESCKRCLDSLCTMLEFGLHILSITTTSNSVPGPFIVMEEKSIDDVFAKIHVADFLNPVEKQFAAGLRSQFNMLVVGLAMFDEAYVDKKQFLPPSLALAPYAPYFLFARSKSAKKAAHFYTEADLSTMCRMWNSPENGMGPVLMNMLAGPLKINEKFIIPIVQTPSAVDPRFPDLTFSKLVPHETFPGRGSVAVKARLLCAKPFSISLPSKSEYSSCLPAKSKELSPTLVLHVHGGGFVSMSSRSHSMYTAVWAKLLGVPVVSLDQRLAPQHKFPASLEDCYTAYVWAVNNAKHIGSIGDKVVLVGDSSGGNMVASIILRAITESFRLPDAVVLCYPVLLVAEVASPARLLSFIDPLLNYGLVRHVFKGYLGDDNTKLGLTNMYVSPLLAPDEVLLHFPPCLILAGGTDPLLDDSIAMEARLRALGRPVTLKLCPTYCHGFLNMISMSKEARTQATFVADWIKLAMKDVGPQT
eukprot:CAMPEP_0184651262 /NCGR_PEP_ID=MMETSP0308-20130426/8846_1 /TAXON_ID=38269 /ORGANISM="Gloeochaete witrockiana, Strain SAG 46.84" /LENGTH=566 /DNA_ID=CAMNT_0027085353 /DNA_START=268 /DNA_END=1968 /DNA_ORIENTATION=+